MDVNKEKMIRDLKKTLDKASDAYYNSGELVMTDDEFDRACITYKKLSGKTYETATKPRKGKKGQKNVNAKHKFENLTGTIDYKFPNMDDVTDWLENCLNELGISKKEDIQILVSKKYDGNSAEGEFEEKKAKRFLSRGDNDLGKDLTDIFSKETIPFKDDMGVRYEVMMTYENYYKLVAEQEARGEKPYVNPRSSVAGILAMGDGEGAKYRKYLTLVPLAVQISNKKLNRLDELEMMDELFAKEIEFDGELYEGNFKEILGNIQDFYDRMIDMRNHSEDELGYMIDGIVIEFIDDDIKEQLGRFANGSPKWSCALKFPYMEKTSVVTGLVFEASPNGSGKVTPSVTYEPVYFNGAKQTKTSIANYKRFKELQPLGVGTKIMVQYRNEVLSYVEKLNVPENDEVEPVPFIKKCPVCFGKLRIHKNDKGEETFVYCDNDDCFMKKIGKVNRYTTTVGIKGIEISTLQKLFSAGLIETIDDLYNLKYRDVSQVEGLGEGSAMNIIDAIKQSVPNDYDILAGLGIENLGRDKAKIILSECSLDSLCDKDFVQSDEFKTRINNLDGIGGIMTKRVSEGLLEYNSVLNGILAHVKFKTIKRDKVENQLIFVHTGDTNKTYFKDRTELKEYIESKGHKMTGSISGKTNYLITENPNSGTVKNKQAKEKGVKIITCAELKDLLG